MTDTYRRCGHPKTPENTRWKANSRGGKDARCLTCLRAYEDARVARNRALNFTASWPIVDPTMTLDELIAEAEADMPNVRPWGHRLSRKTYTIDGDRLTLTAYAYECGPPLGSKGGGTLPAEPLVEYAATRLDKLTAAQRDQLNTSRKRGVISVNSADQIACALGTHPGLLWAEWWLDMGETA